MYLRFSVILSKGPSNCSSLGSVLEMADTNSLEDTSSI